MGCRRLRLVTDAGIGEEFGDGAREGVHSGDDPCPPVRIVGEPVDGVPGEQDARVVGGAPLARPRDAAFLADRHGHGDRGRPGVLQDLRCRHGSGPQGGAQACGVQ